MIWVKPLELIRICEIKTVVPKKITKKLKIGAVLEVMSILVRPNSCYRGYKN